MPVIEIRDSIESKITTDSDGFGYMTRRINLMDGHKFQLESVDVFNDNGLMTLKGDETSVNSVAYQMFISPFPMQRDGRHWGFDEPTARFFGGGQMAGEPNVLYKELGVTPMADITEQGGFNQVLERRFPNDMVGATPTFTWYSPHVYLTVFVWNTPSAVVDVKLSVFMKVKQTKANATSSAMGMYSELLDSQIKLLVDTATIITPDNIAGNTFPSWRFGGIRPEIMLSGTTALRYFNRVASNESQDMVSQGQLFTAFRSATNMVAYDEGFGDVANNLPEWITIMNVAGVTAGPIRPYPPPLKFADNGNTLMF